MGEQQSKAYLGDGVYVWTDGHHIILETSNGVRVTNEVYLDTNVVSELIKFMEKVYNVQIKIQNLPKEGRDYQVLNKAGTGRGEDEP
jgi:hypothetical protein